MAQIDFYFNSNEKLEFAKFLFDKEFTLIPDRNYPTKEYIVLDSLPLYLAQQVKTNEIYYLLHKRYFELELCWSKIQIKGKEVYCIRSRNGGPTIDYFDSRIIKKNGKGSFINSNISHYSSFYTCDLSLNFKASTELIELYKELEKYIKRNTKKIKIQKRWYYIGLETIEDLQKGWCLEGIDPIHYQSLM